MLSVSGPLMPLGTIDFYGTVHIKWRQTSKKTIAEGNADAQCEWAQNQNRFLLSQPHSNLCKVLCSQTLVI